MRQAVVTFHTGKKVTITAGLERVRGVRSYITKPLIVTQCVKNDVANGFTSMVLFGNAWSWELFPEKKAEYDRELVLYIEALPDNITSRTVTDTLPSTEWADKYIPTEEEIKAAQDARKTPEELEREVEEAKRIAEDMEKAEAKRKEQEAADAVEREELPKKYPFLDRSEPSALLSAAKNIRILLARAFPGFRFSVKSERYSGGNHVEIRWTDGPTEKRVREYGDLFLSGNFDGMTDSYNYNPSVFAHLFGHTSYVNYYRSFSTEKTDAALLSITEAVSAIKDTRTHETIAGTDYTVSRDENGALHLWDEHHLGMAFDASGLVGDFLGASIDLEPADVFAADNPGKVEEMEGAIVSRNEKHNGVEVRFLKKPDEEALRWLHSHGFRFSYRQKIWYRKYTPETYTDARERFIARMAPASVSPDSGQGQG